jgi:hypothetical protein
VSGGDGGSDWNTGVSEFVDQTAVCRRSSSCADVTGASGGKTWMAGRTGGAAETGADGDGVGELLYTHLCLGIGISGGMPGRPAARRRYCPARAVMHLSRMASDARNNSFKFMK